LEIPVPTNYQNEQVFFDRVASQTTVEPISQATLDRYATPRWHHLFSKDMMFAVAGDLKGKRVLEVGCGDGITSVELAYCGALVTGIDISPVSIAVARRRAELQGVDLECRVENVVDVESIGDGLYDIVWCDAVLHHLVDSLEAVMKKIHRALKPGGLVIANEPVAYAPWLKAFRDRVPVRTDVTPDEQPLRETEFDAIRKYFPDLKLRYFRIVRRLDRMTGNMWVLRNLSRIDNFLLWLPGMTALAGNAVMWSRK
jgi:SAM-dependent methyltransferase